MNKIHKGIFVVGTGTDVGKTYISALLLKRLLQQGKKATYYKAALSGAINEGGKIIPGDAKYVCKVSGLVADFDSIVSYTFEQAVSPHLAARMENREIKMSKILEDHQYLKDTHEFIVAEGSGGIICPIQITEEETLLLEDIIKALEYPVVIVATCEVGTINHTVLTIDYLRAKGITIKGIIFNQFDKDSVVHKDNVKVIEELTGITILGYVTEGQKDIDIDVSK